jgi:hypothetical protein
VQSHSDISSEFTPTPFWTGHGTQQSDVAFVAVIGLHRSGSSCLAGVLHHLGVHLGDELGGYEPTGGFEAVGLASLCEAAYPFPDTEPALPHDEVVARLRRHVTHVRSSASQQGKQMAGGKYPHLCRMGAALREACGDQLRVVHIERPLDESIASLQERSRHATGWLRIDDAQAERVQRWLWEGKHDLLRQVPHLTVSFAGLAADPGREIKRIVAWLDLTPSEDAVARAVEHVRPELAKRSLT